MGRLKKTVNQHIADGTYNPATHGPLDPDRQIVLNPIPEAPPSHLEPYACEEWERLYAKAVSAGLLTEGEYVLFTAYCTSSGLLREAIEGMSREGRFRKYKTSQDGHKRGEPSDIPNKWYAIYRDALADTARLSSLLGLTSVDRSRVVKSTSAAVQPLPNVRPKTAIDRLSPSA